MSEFMVSVFKKAIQLLTQSDLERIGSKSLARNTNILRCPCCGNALSIDAVYMREDPKYNTRVIERALSCKTCRIRIRQYVYLW